MEHWPRFHNNVQNCILSPSNVPSLLLTLFLLEKVFCVFRSPSGLPILPSVHFYCYSNSFEVYTSFFLVVFFFPNQAFISPTSYPLQSKNLTSSTPQKHIRLFLIAYIIKYNNFSIFYSLDFITSHIIQAV